MMIASCFFQQVKFFQLIEKITAPNLRFELTHIPPPHAVICLTKHHQRALTVRSFDVPYVLIDPKMKKWHEKEV
jgi:hypothetical protein